MPPSNYAQHALNASPVGIFSDTIQNAKERVGHFVDVLRNKAPQENVELVRKIDFAHLSKKAYEPTRERREVEGFDILPEFTSPDRVVYRHQDTGKVIISFRGTDPHSWHGGTESKSFRDLTTDTILALGQQNDSHRFENAERVTKDVVQRFGRENVIATGHSLGGSQALHVSNKFKIHAEVYNPHIDWRSAVTHKNYYHATLHVNRTDPVAAFYPAANFQRTDVRYNTKAAPFLGQHGIENFVWAKSNSVKSKEGGKSNGISSFMNRPQKSVMEKAQESVTPHHPAYLDCSRMPLYMQIQYGCRGGNKAKGGATGSFRANR